MGNVYNLKSFEEFEKLCIFVFDNQMMKRDGKKDKNKIKFVYIMLVRVANWQLQ